MPYIDFVNEDMCDEMDKLSESLFGKELTDTKNMTRDEMISFNKENPNIHISHYLFDEDEYIYSDNDGLVYDENGYLFEDWSDTDQWSGISGIRLRQDNMWETGWYIKD